jgi:hypothetical protein
MYIPKGEHTLKGGKNMWRKGAIKAYESIIHYWVKQYGEGSQYGINQGRISKLTLKRDGKIVANYDRGWDIEPVDKDTEIALAILLKEYN